MSTKMKSAQAVAEAIGCPIENWPGQCYGIASALLRHSIVTDETAELRYGHWTGPVSEDCSVESFKSGPFQRHGWVAILGDDESRIIDPTRWVFEGRDPYIYTHGGSGNCLLH